MPQGSRSMRNGDEPRESCPHADSVGDGNSHYVDSINDGERSPGSTRGIKNTRGWRREQKFPSEPKKGSRSVHGCFIRKKVGSSTPENDGRDDKNSERGGGRDDGGSQSGSRRGGEGNDGRDGKKIAFSSANSNQAQPLDDIPEHPSNFGGSYYSDDEDRETGGPVIRTRWQAGAHFLRDTDKDFTIELEDATRGLKQVRSDGFVRRKVKGEPRKSIDPKVPVDNDQIAEDWGLRRKR
ncbi:hypothetical protein BHYA_0040g00480 [Botrytis hyacinthi]|uniref:Uncharacterized protein n=1 Tax=Botrytis hyacinthi TaxID=278943 RepID=A0A4Z1GWX5_9HELO|nr:hypothetical protein BHYA_0040g00480 [Botrytis hyacinthi]